MNPDDIVKAFVLNGFDTPEKAQALMFNLNIQFQIKQIDIQLDALSAKQTDALKPIQDKRTELQSQRLFLTAQLPTP